MAANGATIGARSTPSQPRECPKLVACPLLRLTGLRKEYPGVVALQWRADALLEIRRGEIHGIVGENGAGKSTLFSVVAGMQTLSGGLLQLGGEDYSPRSVAAARKSGVEIVTQEPGLVGALTVTENLFLGRGVGHTAAGDGRNHCQGAEVALAAVAPHIRPRTLAGTLSLQEQKLVELARAVYFAPRVLLVDEMSAVLDQAGLQTLFEVLRAQRKLGVAVLYISHYLEEVGELCDRVSVLRDGQLVTTLPIGEASAERLSTLMVGRPISDLYPAPPPRDNVQRPLFEAHELAIDGAFKDVSFDVARGEILGIGGLIGCGSASLARALFGQDRLNSGHMTLAGRAYAPRGPRAAIARRVAYVPPDRERDGLLLRSSIGDNVTLPSLPQLSHAGIYLGRGEKRRVSQLIDRLAVRCQGVDDVPLNLSGGNRQKIVLAKWLLMPVDLFILHNPTRGVDVGAKAELYALIRRLAEQGSAIVLVADELPELVGMSSRIFILRRGQISHEVEREQCPTEHGLITHMV